MLFMQSMKKRISGELEVSSSVRYADVPTRKRSGSVSNTHPCDQAPCCLQPWDRAASAFVVRQMLGPDLEHSWFQAAGQKGSCVWSVRVGSVLWCPDCLLPQRSSAAQPTLLQKLPGGVSVEAPKQNIAAGQAAVFAGLGTWAILQVRGTLTSPCVRSSSRCRRRHSGWLVVTNSP